MSVIRVTCGSCRRGWYIAGNGSDYFQLDLVSHPCPYCEAYALSCADDAPRPQERRHPVPNNGSAKRPSEKTADGTG